MLRRRYGTFHELQRRAMSLPATKMRPCSGVSSLLTRRRNVDLPEPDAPTRKTNSPLLMSTSAFAQRGDIALVDLGDVLELDHGWRQTVPISRVGAGRRRKRYQRPRRELGDTPGRVARTTSPFIANRLRTLHRRRTTATEAGDGRLCEPARGASPVRSRPSTASAAVGPRRRVVPSSWPVRRPTAPERCRRPRVTTAAPRLDAPRPGPSRRAGPRRSPGRWPARPQTSSTAGLDAAGYVEEEYFVSGTARSFDPSGTWPTTGAGRSTAARRGAVHDPDPREATGRPGRRQRRRRRRVEQRLVRLRRHPRLDATPSAELLRSGPRPRRRVGPEGEASTARAAASLAASAVAARPSTPSATARCPTPATTSPTTSSRQIGALVAGGSSRRARPAGRASPASTSSPSASRSRRSGSRRYVNGVHPSTRCSTGSSSTAAAAATHRFDVSGDDLRLGDRRRDPHPRRPRRSRPGLLDRDRSHAARLPPPASPTPTASAAGRSPARPMPTRSCSAATRWRVGDAARLRGAR